MSENVFVPYKDLMLKDDDGRKESLQVMMKHYSNKEIFEKWKEEGQVRSMSTLYGLISTLGLSQKREKTSKNDKIQVSKTKTTVNNMQTLVSAPTATATATPTQIVYSFQIQLGGEGSGKEMQDRFMSLGSMLNTEKKYSFSVEIKEN